MISRQLTIHQPPGTTCGFDYYERLALGSHLFPGSSLHSYMYQGSGLTGSKQSIPIPVHDALPQSLSKNMTATQGMGHAWDIAKSAPADLTFGNTCVPDRLTQQVQITVTWTKLAANPSGSITVITHVLATNPSARTITTVASDQILTGTTPLNTSDNISGADLQFSADSFAPAIGTFDNGYVSGTKTNGPVSWTSVLQAIAAK